MYKRVIALTSAALYAALVFLAVVVTDFHDRNFSQALGVESQLGVDFTTSALAGDAALAELQRVDTNYGLGLYRLLPDLDDTGSKVFVDIGVEGVNESIGWFGLYQPARIVGVERLENSPVSGTYLVTNKTSLAEAVAALNRQGVAVVRIDAAPLESIRGLAQDSGFAAPVIAGCALIAAMAVFWLAVRARSRALRVLNGGTPWRIQVQDLGIFALILTASAASVTTAGTLFVGFARGWEYVSSFLIIAAVLEFITLAVSLVVATIMSVASWPSVELLSRRLPAVKSFRWAAVVVQVVTLVALVAYAGPTWAATQNAQQVAKQLQAWNDLSDEVQLAFGMDTQYLDVVAPRFERFVESAEAEGEAALSYTIKEAEWEGDFEGYSAIALVNQGWLELMAKSVGPDALIPVQEGSVSSMLSRELGPSIELWSGGKRDASQVLADTSLYRPSNAIAYPVADGGSLGRLSFLNDVLLVEVPSMSTIFNNGNIVSLASTGNIIFTGAGKTQDRLASVGLDQSGLDGLNVIGTIRTVYVAEQGILEAQFATYLSGLMVVSTVTLALAFLIAVAVNAMIAGLLNAHRDFPIRLVGTRWEEIVRPRALRDAFLAAAIGIVIIFLQPKATLWVTIAVTCAGVAALYFSHVIAASAIFSRVTHRKL